MLNGAMLLFALLFLPETIFDRDDDDTAEDASIEEEKKIEDEQIEIASIPAQAYRAPKMELNTYMRRMWFWDLDRPASRTMKARDFGIKPLSMLKYPSVLFPALYLYEPIPVCMRVIYQLI